MIFYNHQDIFFKTTGSFFQIFLLSFSPFINIYFSIDYPFISQNRTILQSCPYFLLRSSFLKESLKEKADSCNLQRISGISRSIVKLILHPHN